MTISVLFFLIHLHVFAQRAKSAPDTHVHIYVPPEPEIGQQGGQVGQGVALNTGVGNSYQPGLDYEGGTNKKTKSESESGTTAVPRSTAANKNPISDGDEGHTFGHLNRFAVNCGGHMARQCVDCSTNPDDMSDMGSSWCNGDCEWKASDGFGVPVLQCSEKVENWPMLNCGGHVAEDCQRCPEGAPTRELRESYCNGDCEWDLSLGEWDACTNKTKGPDPDLAQWQEWNNWSKCSGCKPGQPGSGLKVRARRCGCDFDQAFHQSCKRDKPCGDGCAAEVTPCDDDEECTGGKNRILSEADLNICPVDKSSISLI